MVSVPDGVPGKKPLRQKSAWETFINSVLRKIRRIDYGREEVTKGGVKGEGKLLSGFNNGTRQAHRNPGAGMTY